MFSRVGFPKQPFFNSLLVLPSAGYQFAKRVYRCAVGACQLADLSLLPVCSLPAFRPLRPQTSRAYPGLPDSGPEARNPVLPCLAGLPYFTGLLAAVLVVRRAWQIRV